MSKFRAFRLRNKAPLREFLIGLNRYVRGLVQRGIDKATAVRKAKERYRGHGSTSRAHWRRWYKANKKHQAQLRAMRQMGGDVRHIPHCLNASWVP